MFEKVNPRQSFPELEADVLTRWQKEKIFERSVSEKPADKTFSFYDGPPFATGLPHYGHLLAGTIKDVIPRFKTMQGYRVERIWGWDTHGLPIENIVEQELDIKTKSQVEELGIDKFNELCRSKVMNYADEWAKIVARTGRWVDMENAYLTMNPEFMESVWWVFSELYKKGFAYEGHKVMPYCPRCATPLSNFEVGQGYKDKRDKAVTVKFELADQPGTYFLAWTTTPWTLPGNLALSVGPKIEYSKVKTGNGTYILATERLESYAEELGDYKLVEKYKGKDLVGMTYKPVFDYYKDIKKALRQAQGKAFVVVDGDHVTTEDGTGIVHTAPAFGEDDYLVAKKHGIDFFMPVDDLGNFTVDVPEYAGKSVISLELNEQIIADLGDKALKVETIKHSYPHCWRCDTPLIYKGVSSWFVAVEKVKKQMLDANKKIYWLPDHVGHNRFAKLIENAPDWSISRNRFWGTPLPVWKCEKCDEKKVVSSVEDLRKSDNYPITKLILFRHGEAENNLLEVRSKSKEKYHLTEKGQKTAKDSAAKLPKNIDIIISSPVLRAQETAEIVKDSIGYKAELVIDERLSEFDFGKWEDIPRTELNQLPEYAERKKLSLAESYETKFGGSGESRADSVERAGKLVEEIVRKYPGKTVLLVTHGAIFSAFEKTTRDLDIEAYYRLVEVSKKGGNRGSAETLYVGPNGKKVDLHKHFMDKVQFKCEKCASKMNISGEVFDCWFESGSMPFSSIHYPFENQEKYQRDYPADFIAEGIDQTRGWFYSLLVLSTALTGKSSYRSVIVNGTVLAENGQKMAKKLRNYPDPMEIVDKYGADAMRFYLMASPSVKAEDFRFAEKGVDEVVKKLILTLWNSYSFFVTYANVDGWDQTKTVKSTKLSLLDRWMVSRRNTLVNEVTDALESHDISKAARSLSLFVDELSNWYIRRSRRRFWKSEDDCDKAAAYQTLYETLKIYVQLLAPFMPFMTDEIYQNLTGEESVHLSMWPSTTKKDVDTDLEKEMAIARNAIELGLNQRSQLGIKVRQPLAALQLESLVELDPQLVAIIAEEVNVKVVKVKISKKLTVKVGEKDVDVAVLATLDTEITPELKAEGVARDFVRIVQESRKKADFAVDDRIKTYFETTSAEIQKAIVEYTDYIKKETLSLELTREKGDDIDYEQTVSVSGAEVWVGVKRAK